MEVSEAVKKRNQQVSEQEIVDEKVSQGKENES